MGSHLYMLSAKELDLKKERKQKSPFLKRLPQKIQHSRVQTETTELGKVSQPKASIHSKAKTKQNQL